MKQTATKPSREIRRLRAALNAVLRMPGMSLYDTDQRTGKSYAAIVTNALTPRKQVRS